MKDKIYRHLKLPFNVHIYSKYNNQIQHGKRELYSQVLAASSAIPHKSGVVIMTVVFDKGNPVSDSFSPFYLFIYLLSLSIAVNGSLISDVDKVLIMPCKLNPKQMFIF